ncbi:MAG TPA: response regulator transcription factor [Chryseolinea sp.]|nr:response regulator transcription factor [Chryseolinea sp.]
MKSVQNLFKRSRHIVVYAALLSALVFLLKWLQWKYLIADYSMEIYVGIVAVAFTSLGLWIATQLTKPKVQTVVVEKEVYLKAPVNEAELAKLNLTNREYEVLKLLTQGCSNAEIAEHLFLSLSTIKTHVSNLFVKMDVKNRTQAVEKANRLKLTP